MGVYGSPELSNLNKPDLVICKKCKHEYFKSNRVCPKCGKPYKARAALSLQWDKFGRFLRGFCTFIALTFVLNIVVLPYPRGETISFKDIPERIQAMLNWFVQPVYQILNGTTSDFNIQTQQVLQTLGDKENPCGVGDTALRGLRFSDETDTARVEMTLNSVRKLQDSINDEYLKQLISKLGTNETVADLKTFFQAEYLKQAANLNIDYLLVDITLKNVDRNSGFKLVSSHFHYVDGGLVSYDDSYVADATKLITLATALSGSVEDYLNLFDVKAFDGVTVYKGASYTGTLLVAVKNTDATPMLVYGDNVCWFSLKQ